MLINFPSNEHTQFSHKCSLAHAYVAGKRKEEEEKNIKITTKHPLHHSTCGSSYNLSRYYRKNRKLYVFFFLCCMLL